MKKIKVLFVITGLYPGGAEHQLERTVLGLDDKKFSVAVASMYGTGKVSKRLKSTGVKIYYLNPRVEPDKLRFATILATLKSYFKLRQIIKKGKPDILYSYLPYANLISRFATIGFDTKTINSIRVKEIVFSWQNTADRLTRSLVDHYTTNSSIVKKFVHKKIKVPSDKITVIYNGLDTKKFSSRIQINTKKKELGISGKKVITMVANLREQKDHKTLLQAMQIISKKKKNIICLIVGDGTTRKQLQEYVSENKLSDYVKFLGERDDIPEILNVTDAAVLATHYEGSPNTVLEAMAAKVPVIASDIPEIKEIIRDGKHGFLFKHGNPEHLASRIEKVLSSPNKKVIKKAFDKIKKDFSIDSMVSKTEKIFEKWT